MPLGASSLAAAVGVGSKNTQFAPSANTLPRRIVIIGTYDETEKTEIDPNTLYLVTSPADVGDRFGFGYMVHRLAQAVWNGSGGIETWVIPQAEDLAAVGAEGTLTVTATSQDAGTVHLYIAGEHLQIPVTTDDTSSTIAAKILTAINVRPDLPVTGTILASTVTIISKPLGPWGNDIDLSFNLGDGEYFPAGVSIAISAMSGGSGLPDIVLALQAMGLNDDQNEKYFTELVHGYGQDATTLDEISQWNGEGDTFLGNYSKIVARPLRSLVGDTASGGGALSSLITFADGRLFDRTNGVIAVPGSPNHPDEIAAQALGVMSRINNDRAAEHYAGQILSGVLPGAPGVRWTSSYDSRDTAVKNGISPTAIEGGSVLLQDLMTFFRPSSVPVDSNSYALQRNIAIIENIMESIKVNFSASKWQGIFIVDDVSKVTNTIDRQKAKDLVAVQNDFVALAKAWEQHGWIFTAAFTIDRIRQGGYISIRAGGTGFDAVIPLLLSGAGRIYNTEVHHDASLTVYLG